jgi:hypothetical protein
MMLTKYWFLVLLLFIIASCSSFLDDKTGGNVHGDVFIKTAIREGDMVYAAVYYTYSNHQMVSAEVYHADDTNNKLSLDSLDYGYTFARFPKENELSVQKPPKGSYYFKTMNKSGHENLTSDFLNDEIIAPPDVTIVSLDRSKQQLTIAWNYDEKAFNHKVTLVGDDGVVVFESQLLGKTENSITIGKNNMGWFSENLSKGNKTFRFVVQSYLFEPIVSPFDLQCLAVNDKETIVWDF